MRCLRLARTVTAAALACAWGGQAFAADAPADNPSDAPVDVVIRPAAPVHRTLLIELNPLPLLTIGKLSVNAVLTPGEHHALVLAPFYAWASTEPIYTFDAAGNSTQLPRQHFSTVGGELGYRYYFGTGGARGLFLGPSVIVGAVKAAAQDGAVTRFWDLGLAADVGYQMLVADRVALGVGAGLQYTATPTSVPAQQFPAELYANAGLRPRLLLSAGWGF
jgi:hypothetical protein